MAYANKKHFTLEEYLELEQHAETKSEYCKGEIFQMSGPVVRQNICPNFTVVFLNALEYD
jgi:Uma2 family endonuclease